MFMENKQGKELRMFCKFAEFHKGYRTISHNVPGYAQGAYFPGDEPGYRCTLSGENCSGHIIDCAFERSKMVCPNCLEDNNDVAYLRDAYHDLYSCPNCGLSYKQEEWLEDIGPAIENVQYENRLKDKTIKELTKQIFS